MWDYSRLSILAFGISAFISGIFTLLSPEGFATQLHLPSSCWPSMNGNGVAAIAMGIYYTLAAFQNNRTFFKLTVPMRFLTTYIFVKQGWIVPGVWEGGAAALTAVALLFER